MISLSGLYQMRLIFNWFTQKQMILNCKCDRNPVLCLKKQQFRAIINLCVRPPPHFFRPLVFVTVYFCIWLELKKDFTVVLAKKRPLPIKEEAKRFSPMKTKGIVTGITCCQSVVQFHQSDSVSHCLAVAVVLLVLHSLLRLLALPCL